MKVIYNEDYKKLFARAQEALIEANVTPHTGDEIVINSLASYYDYLDELVQACSPEFIRNLPSNEQLFQIETNTRKINAPSDLSAANGNPKWIIGVKDDHQAEILWFSIDRFYDDVDLAICFPNLEEIDNDTNGAGQTYIQWKNKEINGLDEVCYVQITEDVDEKDLEFGLESNKIYFGWVLQGDSSTATTRPLDFSGDLTFSVRFQYHQGVKENGRPDLTTPVLFSFNTLPTTCTIHPNLTEQMSGVRGVEDLKIEDISSQGIMRPRFSGIYDNTKGPKPILTEDLLNYVDLNTNNEATLTVNATAGGNLLYQWYKDGGKINEAVTNEYVATTVGSYKVHVGNEYKSGSVRWVESNTCEVPAPSEIEFIRNLPEHAFVDNTLSVEVNTLPDNWSRTTGDVSYVWYREAMGAQEHQTLLENGETVEVIENNSNIFNPEINKPGYYYVAAVNHYNNADTLPIVSDRVMIKVRAVKPRNITFDYDSVNNIITANVDIDHKNDLYYKWINEDNTAYSTGWLKDVDQYSPTVNGNYYCLVTQVIYKDTAIQDGDFTSNYYAAPSQRVPITHFDV